MAILTRRRAKSLTLIAGLAVLGVAAAVYLDWNWVRQIFADYLSKYGYFGIAFGAFIEGEPSGPRGQGDERQAPARAARDLVHLELPFHLRATQSRRRCRGPQ